ncbi:hypothetical protein OAO86_00995 [Euryarchaeota archaeon]|nr:hypothetical protein [Euryarchaeota archaeon]
MCGHEGLVVGKGIEDNSWLIQPTSSGSVKRDDGRIIPIFNSGKVFTITFGNRTTWENPDIAIDESPRDMVLFHKERNWKADGYSPDTLGQLSDNARIKVINRIDVCTRCEIEFTRDITIYSSYSCSGIHKKISFLHPYEQHLPELKISHSCEHLSPTICRKCWCCDGCATYMNERVDAHKKEHTREEIDWDDPANEPYGWKR